MYGSLHMALMAPCLQDPNPWSPSTRTP
jgi:hypothetical protein